MQSERLNQLVDASDATAIQMARELGPAASDLVADYLEHPSRKVRLIAVDVAAAVGGPRGIRILVEALKDADEQVHVSAINGLHRHLAAGAETELLAIWDRTPDRFIKQQIPLVIGRSMNAGTISLLQQRLSGERSAYVLDGLIAGLAKLGDTSARTRFAELLAAGEGERIAELMEYVQYLDDAWVLPHLYPLLDHTENALVIGTHIKTIVRRGCDIVVDEVLRISGFPFSFPADPSAQYTSAQIGEVAAYLQQCDPSP
jgi:hypothetical protein